MNKTIATLSLSISRMHFTISKRSYANGFSYLALIFICEIGFHVSAETDPALSSSDSDGGYFIRFDEKGKSATVTNMELTIL